VLLFSLLLLSQELFCCSGPRLVAETREEELARAREWMAWSARYAGRGESLKRTKLHLFKRMAGTMQERLELREHLSLVNTRAELLAFLEIVQQILGDPLFVLPPLPVKETKPKEDTSDDCWVLFED
jgi:hypothetical protein